MRNETWDSEANGRVHERYGMGMCTNYVKCGVAEWVIGSVTLTG